MAYVWMLSQICESFHCLPAEAERLWLDDEDHLVMEILEFRSYARAKSAYDSVDGKIEKLDKSPVMDLVIQNDFLSAKEDT